MKLTKSQLRRIIKEELSRLFEEEEGGPQSQGRQDTEEDHERRAFEATLDPDGVLTDKDRKYISKELLVQISDWINGVMPEAKEGLADSPELFEEIFSRSPAEVALAYIKRSNARADSVVRGAFDEPHHKWAQLLAAKFAGDHGEYEPPVKPYVPEFEGDEGGFD